MENKFVGRFLRFECFVSFVWRLEAQKTTSEIEDDARANGNGCRNSMREVEDSGIEDPFTQDCGSCGNTAVRATTSPRSNDSFRTLAISTVDIPKVRNSQIERTTNGHIRA